MKCAILFKTKKDGLVAIFTGLNNSDENVKKGLSLYTKIPTNKFICLSSSMSYGIYGLKDHYLKFKIKRWLNGGAKNPEYAHTFKVKYIKTVFK